MGVAEVVLCSEDHTPKESQQRYMIPAVFGLTQIESILELWGIENGLWNIYFCRQWLEGVVQVMLNSPWKTQKAAAQCLSRAVEHQPKTALMSLDILEAVQEKVGMYRNL